MPLKIPRVLRYALEDMIDLESSSEQRRLIIESIPPAPPVLSRALPVALAAVSSTDGLLDTLARPPSIQLDEQGNAMDASVMDDEAPETAPPAAEPAMMAAVEAPSSLEQVGEDLTSVSSLPLCAGL